LAFLVEIALICCRGVIKYERDRLRFLLLLMTR
jgi:hypothetical protein